jgi:hypothetical protein
MVDASLYKKFYVDSVSWSSTYYFPKGLNKGQAMSLVLVSQTFPFPGVPPVPIGPVRMYAHCMHTHKI